VTDLAIRGGRVLDPSQNLDRVCDLLLSGGRVVEIGDGLSAEREVDARGLLIVPGLIDLHAHLREPGLPTEETVATGSAAAVAGGFTTVLAMPNTDPPLDTPAALAHVYMQAARAKLANVFPVGCVTRGRAGKELAEMRAMADAGAVAFSDDGDWIASARVMKLALEYARPLELPILSHCEEPELCAGGVINEGEVSARLGLPARPACAEEIAVSRDLRLAGAVGGRLHVCHVSTAGSVDLIRAAKRRGFPVTCEVTPHHLMLTDEALAGCNPLFKVNPPLRTADDCRALLEGLIDGTVDAVATDHAPHAPEEKELEITAAPSGVLGLETALALVLDRLVDTGLLDVRTAVYRLTAGPAAALGLLPRGTLRIGAPADVTVVDPEHRWYVDPAGFRTPGVGSPFAGWELKGRAVLTVVGGDIKFQA
jgi:dihydroorotase